MLLISAPWLIGSLSLIALVFTLGVFAFIATTEQAHRAEVHDPEQANLRLTMKLRQPWRYQVMRWF